LITASPPGERRSPAPKGAERGGYLPIPRRDERAGGGYPTDMGRSQIGRSGLRPMGEKFRKK